MFSVLNYFVRGSGMKKILISAFLLVLLPPVVASADLIPLKPLNAEYYSKALPGATYKTVLAIDDPFSYEPFNIEYFKIYDQNSQFIGYIREVYTNTGCEGFCKLLDFTLAYDAEGLFLNILVRKPLTKDMHAAFSEEDYRILYNILKNPPQSFNFATTPKDMIDAVTGATDVKYKKDVIPTAAHTSFRVHQYNQHTQSAIRKCK